eukprot:403332783
MEEKFSIQEFQKYHSSLGIQKHQEFYEKINHGIKQVYQQSNQKFPLCYFNRLNRSQGDDSKHIVVCIPGFISEEENDIFDWRFFSQYCDNFGISCFSYKWQSREKSKYILRIKKVIKLFQYALILSIIFGPMRLYQSFALFLIFLIWALGFSRVTFRNTKKIAKLNGKMLAYALALQYPFKLNTISFVSFSLGSQVAKQCIKSLHDLGVKDLIHNQTFIAGATNINNILKHENATSMDKILSETVSGTVKSVFNHRDLILGYTNYFQVPKRLMGRQSILHDHHRNKLRTLMLPSQAIKSQLSYQQQKYQIMQQESEEREELGHHKFVEDDYLFKFQNYDLTDYVTWETLWDKVNKQTHMGHFFYRKKFDLFIDRVDFQP